MTSSSAASDVVNETPVSTKRWVRRRFATRLGREFEVSVGVVRGARPGPVLANVAGQHGSEHIGLVVLRDIFHEINPSELVGTLLLCPCANPLALEMNCEAYPEHLSDPEGATGEQKVRVTNRDELGETNMNRVWGDDIAGPSRDGEGIAQQIARWLWSTMIQPAQVVIDHHSVKRSIKPYVFVEDPAIP